MGLFAEKDGTGKVLRVVVCDSAQWLAERLGGTWVETSETTTQVNGAGPGMYDSETIAPKRFIPPWVQPTHAENAYPVDAWVWHDGKAWLNLTAANTQVPGVSGWREKLTEWPAFVQPAGAHDAYRIGEKITEANKRYVCKVNATTWPPSVVPSSWTLQP